MSRFGIMARSSSRSQEMNEEMNVKFQDNRLEVASFMRKGTGRRGATPGAQLVHDKDGRECHHSSEPRSRKVDLERPREIWLVDPEFDQGSNLGEKLQRIVVYLSCLPRPCNQADRMDRKQILHKSFILRHQVCER